MNTIDQAKLVIQNTTLLSSLEKTEWIQLLPAMNEKQLQEFLEILAPGQHFETKAPVEPIIPVAPKPVIPPVLKPVAKPMQVDIHEKEIGTSKPLYELELPEHATAPKPPEPVIPKAQSVVVPQIPVVPAPSDPTELQRRVENIVKELQQKNTAPKPQAPPVKPQPAEVIRPEPALAPKPQKPVIAPRPKTQPEPLQLRALEDFKKLTPAHLHGDTVAEDLQNIILSINALSNKYKPFDLVAAIEQSSLYKTYLGIGMALLDDSNPDRDSAYAKVIKDMDVRGDDFLTKEEFEAFTDFRKKLEQFM
ncbi:MAG: hypothetical protein G01um101477_337 [Candidatus Doudnabacteria bacterium Gr01-1014_77]|uniref:EF-hand domain-containing protein n=1 Tax=Candidatus Doudnabacteria bacterium Gr01-1014_77 TaxID=2017133 RepID=A0A554JBM0_9BACT|nr:MAG: hypothetical protein G01um101477_337 [Candidatus Doudnabacteria bacterium Gr01-1014_77]